MLEVFESGFLEGTQVGCQLWGTGELSLGLGVRLVALLFLVTLSATGTAGSPAVFVEVDGALLVGLVPLRRIFVRPVLGSPIG